MSIIYWFTLLIFPLKGNLNKTNLFLANALIFYPLKTPGGKTPVFPGDLKWKHWQKMG